LRRQALSLLEVVVGLGLLALIMPLALNLIPSGRFAQKRALSLEAATALAQGWLEETRNASTLSAGVYRQQTVQVGQLTFRAVQEHYGVDAYLMDVVVVVQPPQGQPVRLATRMARP